MVSSGAAPAAAPADAYSASTHGDPGADGQARAQAAAQRPANEEERHRPHLGGDEEAEPEADGDRVHAGM